MVTIEIKVRDPESGIPDWSLQFELPEIPRVGDYISIQRPEHRSEWGEDLIVRHVWWRLRHSETRTQYSPDEAKLGGVREVIVECDPAIGPWSSDRWRDSLKSARERGATVEDFDVKRLSVREDRIG